MQKISTDPSISRVLIFRIGTLGDTVAALPCFHLIARAFPDATRMLLTDASSTSTVPAAQTILEGSGLVHRFITYQGATRSPLEILRTVVRIRSFRPDVLVYLMPLRSSASVARDRRFFRLAGVKRIIGLPGMEENTHRKDHATGLYESESSRLARCIAALGDAEPEHFTRWGILPTLQEQQRALTLLAEHTGKPILCCGPASKMQSKDWTTSNWKSLLASLSKRHPDFHLVLVGSANDRSICDDVASAWRGPFINLAGRSTPRESAAVFQHALAFIGPDSAAKHLAASVGTPCVTIFSARDLPGVWFPPGDENISLWHNTECAGCMLETCIEKRRKCILSITVDDVEAAVESLLTRRSPATHSNQTAI